MAARFDTHIQASRWMTRLQSRLRHFSKARHPIGSLIVGLASLLILSACNTTKLMYVPVVSYQTPISVDKPIREQATFALSKVVANIKRGTVIGHYPAGSIKGVDGTLCNQRHRGLSTITWGTGTSVLGNWSTELGEVFYETLSSAGLNIAGDPTDLFGQAETVGSAEYLIGGRITKISSNVCQEHDFWNGFPMNSFGGEMHIAVEWTVFSNLAQRKVLSNKTSNALMLHTSCKP